MTVAVFYYHSSVITIMAKKTGQAEITVHLLKLKILKC